MKGKLNQTLRLDLDEAIDILFLTHINQALPISFLEVDNKPWGTGSLRRWTKCLFGHVVLEERNIKAV